MIAAKFHCPGCKAELECPLDEVALGMECPGCKLFFTPAVESEAEKRTGKMPGGWKTDADGHVAQAIRRQQLTREARNIALLAWISLLLALLSALAALILWPAPIYMAGFLIPVSLALFTLSQLFHIRAALAK